MSTPKILALANSLRKDSLNRKLVRAAAESARAEGAEVTVLDLAEYPLPIYDGDLEGAGAPPNAKKLRDLFSAQQGFLLSTPEYNGSIPGLAKNAFDWASRVGGKDEDALGPFWNKPLALLSASPGGFGAMRSLVQARLMFGFLGFLVLPDSVSLPKAASAFDPQGALLAPPQADSVKRIGQLIVLAAKTFDPYVKSDL